MITKARYSESLPNQRVICHLCPANCKLSVGQRGICQSRMNLDGDLVTENYGELVSVAVDPIEKKPLYHFYPGSEILSTGANSCNLSCANCQNWSISQKRQKTIYCPPAKLVAMAVEHNSIGVAFTYTEPFIWFEYIMECAPLLHEKGLKVVLVSNGYVNKEPLAEIIEHIDAINIDLKSIRPEFYKKVCKGSLSSILDNIRVVHESKTHLEITNLIIPGFNDSDQELVELVKFVADLSDSIPLHLSAYHPEYKMDAPATPLETIVRAKEIADQQLKYVYVGNISLEGGSDTICRGCATVLVKRGYEGVESSSLEGGKCSKCGIDASIIM